MRILIMVLLACTWMTKQFGGYCMQMCIIEIWQAAKNTQHQQKNAPTKITPTKTTNQTNHTPKSTGLQKDIAPKRPSTFKKQSPKIIRTKQHLSKSSWKSQTQNLLENETQVELQQKLQLEIRMISPNQEIVKKIFKLEVDLNQHRFEIFLQFLLRSCCGY